MSGEAVVVSVAVASPVGLAVVAGAAAVVAVGSVAAYMLAERRAEFKRLATEKKRDETQRNASLQAFEAFASVKQQEHAEQQQVLLRLASFTVQDTQPAAETRQTMDDGYLNNYQQQRAALAALQTLLSTVPAALLQAEGSPFPRLQARIAAMQAQDEPVLPDNIESFQAMLKQTIQLQLQQQDEQQAYQFDLFQRTKSLLDTVVTYKYLAAGSALEREFVSMQALLEYSLQAIAERGESIDLLEEKAAELKTQVDQYVIMQAARAAAEERMRMHLESMDYQWLEDDDDGRSYWRIPGGDRVAVALKGDLRIGFQFQHERSAQDSDMGNDEIKVMREQEKRWCKDLKQLIRQLVMDGFQYHVELEREIPQASIPIVVVDDAGSWEADERARSDAPKARYQS
ncbi:MAG: hypothetical protein Q9M09_03140 [Mariprofundaceae bacterium]|nr:hypothetical protein [Mariprofundaceae bacterium]